MALLTLTPTSGSPASIQVDEIDIYRVTPNGTGSTVVYSGQSAFLGDQQTVIVNESVSAIDNLSTALVTLTIGSVSTLVNAFNIFDVVTDAIGSKIMYKEFGLITYIFSTETPATVKALVNTALASIKVAQVGATYNGAGPNSPTATELSAGIIAVTTAGASALALPSFADLSSVGLKIGGTMVFYVNNTGGGTVTVSAGANGTMQATTTFTAPNSVTAVPTGTVAKYEIYANSSTTYIAARLY